MSRDRYYQSPELRPGARMSLLRDHYITVCKSNRRDRRGSWKRLMCGQSSQRILNASTESLTPQIVMTKIGRAHV